jgi:hypothetical protein
MNIAVKVLVFCLLYGSIFIWFNYDATDPIWFKRFDAIYSAIILIVVFIFTI